MTESPGEREFSDQFIETLRELAAELSEDLSEADIADEHVRFDLYRKAAGPGNEDKRVFAQLSLSGEVPFDRLPGHLEDGGPAGD